MRLSTVRDHLAAALISVATMLCAASPAWAAAPRCIDRQPAADRPAGVPARLASLTYDCTRLSNGHAMWIGEAGTEHTTTVLLVHGLGQMAHRDWRDTIEPLARQFHVIAVDLPGFGSSEAFRDGYAFDSLDEVLDEVVRTRARDARAHVVGHSLGGAVSLHFAHRHPQRVRRLVLVDAAGILLMNVLTLPSGRVTLPETGFTPVDRFTRRLDAHLNGLGRSVLGRIDTQMDPGPWLKKNPGTRNALFGKYTQVDAALGLVVHDFTPIIREQRLPTTLIWGSDDTVAPLRTGRLLAARLPDARLRVIDGAGHVPMTERPAEFMNLLEAALVDARDPAPAPPPLGDFQGDAMCNDRVGARYEGDLGEVSLRNCHSVVIRNARLRKLTLANASVTLENVTIEAGPDVAIEARRSQVVATHVKVSGRVALRATGSTLDIAGSVITATERAVEITSPSWVYFSVSEIDAPDRRGDAHLAWPSRVNAPEPAATRTD